MGDQFDNCEKLSSAGIGLVVSGTPNAEKINAQLKELASNPKYMLVNSIIVVDTRRTLNTWEKY